MEQREVGWSDDGSTGLDDGSTGAKQSQVYRRVVGWNDTMLDGVTRRWVKRREVGWSDASSD